MKISDGKFITCFLFSLFIGIHLFSCTPSKRLTLNGEKDYIFTSECGNVTITCFWAYHMLYIEHQLSGSFLLHPDSFKVGFYPDSLETRSIKFYVDMKEVPTDEITNIENNHLLIKYIGDFNTISKDGSRRVLILPSNYIMCGDKPLITNTITIK